MNIKLTPAKRPSHTVIQYVGFVLDFVKISRWDMKRTTLNILIISILILLIGDGTPVSLEEDLTLNYKQKLVLDEFKELVSKKLPHEYMKEDIYLIRWLRARNFNLEQAEEMLLQNLAWRKENRMDTVHQEDWTDYRKQYKYWIDGEDKEGRPILLIDVGEWDLRKAVVTGQGEKMGRFIDKVLDEVAVKVREMRLNEGKNVTQYYHIFDMDGYNIVEQGCPVCIALTIRLVTTYENYNPGGCHKIVLINTPGVFQTLFQILRPFMSPMTRDSFTVYGRNKNEYGEALLKDIAKDQLARELGGTRILPEY